MNINTKKFIYIVSNKDVCSVAFGGDRMLPILWNRDGIFRIVPVAKIKNEFMSVTSSGRICAETTGFKGKIKWVECIPVAIKFARLLIGDDVNNECTYKKGDNNEKV